MNPVYYPMVKPVVVPVNSSPMPEAYVHLFILFVILLVTVYTMFFN